MAVAASGGIRLRPWFRNVGHCQAPGGARRVRQSVRADQYWSDRGCPSALSFLSGRSHQDPTPSRVDRFRRHHCQHLRQCAGGGLDARPGGDLLRQHAARNRSRSSLDSGRPPDAPVGCWIHHRGPGSILSDDRIPARSRRRRVAARRVRRRNRRSAFSDESGCGAGLCVVGGGAGAGTPRPPALLRALWLGAGSGPRSDECALADPQLWPVPHSGSANQFRHDPLFVE